MDTTGSARGGQRTAATIVDFHVVPETQGLGARFTVYKLTLSFRGRILKVATVAAREISIGRDPACELHIDNLGLNAVHARVHLENNELILSDTSASGGILVNSKPIEQEQPITHGDVILIGKHTVTVTRDHTAGATDAPAEPPPQQEGWLQFLNGPKLGRTIRLDRSLVRLGKSGSQSAMIASRGDGFYISHLEGEQPTRVGEQTVGEESTRLNDGDTIQIGDTRMLFFTKQL